MIFQIPQRLGALHFEKSSEYKYYRMAYQHSISPFLHGIAGTLEPGFRLPFPPTITYTIFFFRKISCPNTSLIWEQLAIAINQNKNNVNLISSTHNLSVSDASNKSVTKSKSSVTLASIAADVLNTSYSGDTVEYRDVLDGLEMIPNYYANELTIPYSLSVNEYLRKAFSSPFHPLSNLLMGLCDCFTATYVS